MKQSGIYAIINTTNDKFYIGSAQNIKARWAEHRRDLRRGDHNNQHLQRAWNKYGAEAFVFTVLFSCTLDVFLDREQHCLDTLRPEYNVARDARAPMLGLKHTTAAKSKIAKASKARGMPRDVINKAAAVNRGSKHTSDHIEKVRATLFGNTRKRGKKQGPHSPEHSAKIAAALRGKPKSPEHCANIAKAKQLEAKLKKEKS